MLGFLVEQQFCRWAGC